MTARWEALMQSVEGPYAKAVAAEKNRYITESSLVFASTLRLEDTLFDYHRASMAQISARFQSVAIRIALIEMRTSLKGKSLKDDWEQLWLWLVRKWVEEYGAQAARETAQTTRDDMQSIVDAALAHDVEFNPQAVASDLLKAKDLSKPRAETIARTETHNAMMFASVEGAAKIGRDNDIQFKKKWVPVLDARTRSNHAGMSSHPAIPMDSDFNVGGVKMSRPGDPRGGPANVINCRCVLVYEVVE